MRLGLGALALGLGALGLAGPASALNLVTQVNILTAVQDATLPPNCSLTTLDATVLDCQTTAGAAKGQAGFGVMRVLADTRGTPASGLHQASGVSQFSEDLVFGIDGTLRTTIQVTGQVAVAPGTVSTSGFIQTNWTEAQLVLATGDVTVRSAANTQLEWNFDQTSGGPFSETVIVDLPFSAGVPLIYGGTFAASISGTGLLLDFFDTAQIEQFETFDAGGSPVILEIRNSEGELLGVSVPEPQAASLVALTGLAFASIGRRR